MTILNQIKEMVEVDVEEEIFDTQLLSYINSGNLEKTGTKNTITRIDKESELTEWNKIEEDDKETILDWLHLRCVQRFDKSLMIGNSTTMSWIDEELTNILYQLKAIYGVKS